MSGYCRLACNLFVHIKLFCCRVGCGRSKTLLIYAVYFNFCSRVDGLGLVLKGIVVFVSCHFLKLGDCLGFRLKGLVCVV